MRRPARSRSISRGRNTISPTSDSAKVKARVLRAASNASPASRSFCSRSTSGRDALTRACARGVGAMPRAARMNSGSLKCVAQLAQRHADRRLAHAERLGGAAHARSS